MPLFRLPLTPAVVPVLIGPLQVLLTILPGLLLAVASAVITMLKPRAIWNLAKLVWRQKVAAIVLIAAITGLVYGAGHLRQRFGPRASQAVAGVDWPLFRGSPARLGVVGGEAAPLGGGVNWSWKQKNEAFFSSPAVAGNRVYVASATLGFRGIGESGTIYCFDTDTGALAWKNAPEGYRPTFSSPVISGKYLVCGEGLHFTQDSRVVCLDTTQGGKVVWAFRTKNHVECTPVIHDGRVYFGAGNDGYYCLALEPGADGQAQVLWHLPGGEKYPDSETALIADGSKLYAGLGINGCAIAILDAATGRELKRIPMPYPVFSPPAIADGKLYVGMGQGDFVHSGKELLDIEVGRLRDAGATPEALDEARRKLAPGGQVVCLDVATEQILWTCKTPDTILGTVVVDRGEAFFADRSGTVYALSAQGKVTASFDTHAVIRTSPCVTPSHVYVVNGAGALLAIDRRTFTPAWELQLGTAQAVAGEAPLYLSSPAIARGRLFVGTQFDGFLCVGDRGGNLKTATRWSAPLGGGGAAGNPDRVPLPATGAYEWSFPADQSGQSTDLVVSHAPAAVDKRLLVPVATGPFAGLVALPGGAPAAATPTPIWKLPVAAGLHTSPVVADSLALVVTGKRGAGDRELLAIEHANGNITWRASVAANASGTLQVTGQDVLVEDQPGQLSCYSLTGSRRWSVAIGPVAHAPAVLHQFLVVATQDNSLCALDLPTGTTLWKAPLASPPVGAPVVAAGALYLPTARGLDIRSPLDGRLVATLTPAPSADFALTRTCLFYVSDDGQLIAVDRASHGIIARLPGARAGTVPLATRDSLLFHSSGSILRVPLDELSAKPSAWLDTSWLGTPASGMVAHDNHLYFPAAGWGLVRAGGAQ